MEKGELEGMGVEAGGEGGGGELQGVWSTDRPCGVGLVCEAEGRGMLVLVERPTSLSSLFSSSSSSLEVTGRSCS